MTWNQTILVLILAVYCGRVTQLLEKWELPPPFQGDED